MGSTQSTWGEVNKTFASDMDFHLIR